MREFIRAIEAADPSNLVEDYQGVELRREKFAMGLETLYGQSFALTGGWRSGGGPLGLMRCAYSIIDVDAMKNGASQQDATLGQIEVYKDDKDDIVGLINIKLSPNKRKAGVGSAVVQSLAKMCPDHFVIWDIQQKAIGFWKKMGCDFFTDTGKFVEQPKGFKGLLVGVMRKPNSDTPVSSLKGFRKSFNKPKTEADEPEGELVEANPAGRPDWVNDEREETEAKQKLGPYPHHTNIDGVQWMDTPGFSIARKGDVSLIVSKRGDTWHWSIECTEDKGTRSQAKTEVTDLFKRL